MYFLFIFAESSPLAQLVPFEVKMLIWHRMLRLKDGEN